MAKKSSKKSKLGLVGVVGGLLGIVALVLFLVLPVVSYTVLNSTSTYTGIQVAFGYSEKGLLGSVEILKFGFLAFLAVLLLLIGAVVLVLGVLAKKQKLLVLCGAVVLVVGAILVFLSPVGATWSDAIAFTLEHGAEKGLAVGGWVAGILGVLGGLAGVYSYIKE